MRAVDVLDTALDRMVVPGFSRIGYSVRSRLGHWDSEPEPDLRGRTAVVTGATSGIGAAAALDLSKLGAEVHLVGRNEERGHAVVQQVDSAGGTAHWHRRDLSDLDEVDSLGEWLASLPALDVLVHNAGVLVDRVTRTKQGIEVTAAVHVVAPHRLTAAALPALRRAVDPDRGRPAGKARVITVSSGGMYTQPLMIDWLSQPPTPFNGPKVYANAKRAQVALSEWWAAREPGVAFHAMHPGWVDTPGVQSSLPRFASLTGPILRTPEQGADTIVWLASTERGLPSGRFWCDRRERPTEYLHRNAHSDQQVAQLIDWLDQRGSGPGLD